MSQFREQAVKIAEYARAQRGDGHPLVNLNELIEFVDANLQLAEVTGAQRGVDELAKRIGPVFAR